MQFKKPSLFFYFLFITLSVFCQINNQGINFRSPVDFPIYLSGNFGEIRTGHFHAGIDIKTQGVIGKKIYSVDDGYVSRIKISANSYGKTIYINHPNGYTTVYGHLSRFNDFLEKYAKNIQYQNNEYELNYFPTPNEIPIEKGQLIAFSGNTGSSDGAHLHFEVRETNEQIPVNPLFFNFKIEDNIPPVFYALELYPLGKNSTINSAKSKISFQLNKNNNSYTLADTNNIYLSGEIGFGIEINDFLNKSHNRCGIYTLSVFVDNVEIYNHIIDKISFSETGYIKSHIDYAEKTKSKRTIQKTFIAPNNKLSIYKSNVNNGIFCFNKDTLHTIKIIATDVYNNKSELIFNVIGQIPELPSPNISEINNSLLMNWESENEYIDNEIKVVIPPNALFDTLHFKYSKSDPIPNSYSCVHHIHNKFTPLLKNYSISIKHSNLNNDLKDKALIAQLLEDNEIASIGGKVVNGYIVSEINEFGDFVVLVDTIAPKIKPILNSNTSIKSNKIKFKITDELSGIKSYNGYIDNNWALFEYDMKNDMLFYIIDEERIRKNTEHELELFVIDKKGNISTYYTTFYW